MHPVHDPPVAGDAYVGLDLTGTDMRYRQQPVAYHGEEFDYVDSGRQVVEIPGRTWPAARPEECTSAEVGLWITPQLLVCPGCGLDCT